MFIFVITTLLISPYTTLGQQSSNSSSNIAADEDRRTEAMRSADALAKLRESKSMAERMEMETNSLAKLVEDMVRSADVALSNKMDLFYDNHTDLERPPAYRNESFNCEKEFNVSKVLEQVRMYRKESTLPAKCEEAEDGGFTAGTPVCSVETPAAQTSTCTSAMACSRSMALTLPMMRAVTGKSQVGRKKPDSPNPPPQPVGFQGRKENLKPEALNPVKVAPKGFNLSSKAEPNRTVSNKIHEFAPRIPGSGPASLHAAVNTSAERVSNIRHPLHLIGNAEQPVMMREQESAIDNTQNADRLPEEGGNLGLMEEKSKPNGAPLQQRVNENDRDTNIKEIKTSSLDIVPLLQNLYGKQFFS